LLTKQLLQEESQSNDVSLKWASTGATRVTLLSNTNVAKVKSTWTKSSAVAQRRRDA